MVMHPAILIGSIFLTIAAVSQNPTDGSGQATDGGATDKETRKNYWEANVAGGNYLVALGRISSVSRHKYVLDGAVIVDEVTVDTTGQALARFYFLSPITASGPGAAVTRAAGKAKELVGDAASRAGADVQDMVVKKYPLTTHSKSIEYRLLSEQQLNMLYQSVKTAWVTGRGRVYSAG